MQNVPVSPRTRPAEWAAATAAVALILGRAFGVHDPDVLTAIGTLCGVLPTIVTGAVHYFRGGKRGRKRAE